jgi:hypothetical protein
MIAAAVLVVSAAMSGAYFLALAALHNHANLTVAPASFCQSPAPPNSCTAIQFCSGCDVGAGATSFTKTTTTAFAMVWVYAPLRATQWKYVMGCPA